MAENNWADAPTDEKLGIVDPVLTPGDILGKTTMISGWMALRNTSGTSETWIYSEATIQVKAFGIRKGICRGYTV